MTCHQFVAEFVCGDLNGACGFPAFWREGRRGGDSKRLTWHARDRSSRKKRSTRRADQAASVTASTIRWVDEEV